jgi:N-acetylmuramoyl-L-alanine amidase
MNVYTVSRMIDVSLCAHCLGYNTNSIGICAEGNFMNEAMPEVQKQALKELIQNLKGKYKVGIKGHKELNATDCPGTNYPLDELKTVQVEIPITIIDVNSFKYLQHEIGVTEDNKPGPITLSKCPLVRIGANSNVVRWIQSKLGVAVDGIFGRQTLIAVQNFQARNDLKADGIVGSKT